MKAHPLVKAAALELVSRFEGSAGGAINTTDGQLLSYGSIQYALLVGALHPFLLRTHDLNPPNFRRIMGSPFTDALRAGKAAFTQWVRTNVTPKPVQWRGPFRELWNTPERSRADVEFAAGYLAGAEKLCNFYELYSQRAYAFFADRSVQQGTAPRAVVSNDILRRNNRAEWQLLKAAAHLYADSANPRWHDDVLSRSLTIALGSSVSSGWNVHGRPYDLEDYGLTMKPMNLPPEPSK